MAEIKNHLGNLWLSCCQISRFGSFSLGEKALGSVLLKSSVSNLHVLSGLESSFLSYLYLLLKAKAGECKPQIPQRSPVHTRVILELATDGSAGFASVGGSVGVHAGDAISLTPGRSRLITLLRSFVQNDWTQPSCCGPMLLPFSH